jgi:Mn2+/Fe2+ NRAMP family transporter
LHLFFWQASQEVEEVEGHAPQHPVKQAPQQAPAQFARIRLDTFLGMAFSNIVAWAIILTAAATLHAQGQTDIQTAEQAAKALEPLAGHLAFVLFALGIVGTGLLAIPVLAGSAAYGVGEALEWRTGLERAPSKARGFYSVIAIATVIGATQNFLHINPMKALFWTAVINGVVAVPVLVMMMLMAGNSAVMGQFTVGRRLKAFGWITTAVMLAAAIGMFASM